MNHRTLHRLSGLAALPLLVLAMASRASADYPIMSHRYLADPGFLVYDGRVYLYNSNDDDNNGGYQMRSIVCVSSVDMKNWTDHGIVFQTPADASWANMSWAPQPISKNGKIFLYFGNNASAVGVASSSSPTGGFKDAKGGSLVNGSTPGASGTNSWLFDPGAMIDDDGQAYLSFGGNGINNGRIIKLGSDLVSVSGSAVAVTTTSFFEASFLFKRNDIYYFAFSTNTENGLRIDYHRSSSPMSGYTYGGIIAGQPPSNNNNNHASEFEFNGRWYHAYHNRYVANQAGIDATYKRNLALEVLDFNADGSIKQVTYTTDGVPQVGTLDPYVRVEAETMNAQSGIETETCSEGGMNVTDISNGDWIRVRGVDFGTGATSFTARVASTAAGGAIELRSGSATGTLLGTCAVPSTGGAQTWANATCNVTGATGVVKDLYLKFTGGNFKLNYWQFTGSGSSGGTGGASSGGSGNSGGATNAGGVQTSGGRANAGGAAASGGAAAGGRSNTGGRSAGGGSPSGGATSAGGNSSSTSNGGTTSSSGGNVTNGGAQSAEGGSRASGGNATTNTNPSSGGATGAALGGGQGIGGAVTTAIPAGGIGNVDQTSDDGSCGCRVVGGPAPSRSMSMFGMLGLLLLPTLRRRLRE